MKKSPMFGKNVVWAWVALCLGFAAGHLLSRADRLQERAVLERMRKEFDSLKEETKAASAAQHQMAALKQELAAAQEALAAALAPPTPPPATDPAAAVVDRKQAFSEMVLRIGHDQLKRQINGKLGVLVERLQLSPEQEATVKKILEDESAEATAALDRLMAGEGAPADFGRLARLQRGELPGGVESVLADGQQADYAAFKEQEKISGVENRANMELSGLITAGSLTPEQKDRAFSTLSGVLMAEDGTDFDSMPNAAAVRAFMDEATQRRLDALQPILSEPQWSMYQQQVEVTRQVMSKLMPADPQ